VLDFQKEERSDNKNVKLSEKVNIFVLLELLLRECTTLLVPVSVNIYFIY